MATKIIKFDGWCIDRIALPIWTTEGEYTLTVSEGGYESVRAVIDEDSNGFNVIVKLNGERPEECKHMFRLCDDDGDVYAYGWSKDNESERAFDPLDWAASQWGCTYIEYCNPETGEWEML